MTDVPPLVSDARSCLARYLAELPEAAERLGDLSLQLIEEPVRILDRSNMRGHLTASGLVMSPDMTEVLLIDHLVLQHMLPAGGHAEEGPTLQDDAVREIAEETGVCDIETIGASPIDVDTHPIPANPRKGEGDHFHHDFMFAFVARSKEIPVPQLEEVASATWIPTDVARTDPRIDRSLRRLEESTKR